MHEGNFIRNTSLIVLVFFLLLFTKPFTIVNAGDVGIVYSFGSIIGQLDEGFHLIAPWQFVTHTNVRIQKETIEKLTSFSKETQNVYIKASLNFQVSPDAIQKLFRTVGKNYFHILVESRLMQNFKDETVKYDTTDIAPNREQIRKDVKRRLETELKPYSIHVIDLLLDDISFDPAFNNAILNKQVRTQNALEEKQRIEVFKAQAQQNIEKAKGEAEAVLVAAIKQAEANQKLAASITPTLVQYKAIEQWDGVRPMVEGSGSGLLIQLPAPVTK